MKLIHVLVVTTVFCGMPVFAAETPPLADGVKRWTVPDHTPLPPEARGKPYKVPATQWEKRPVIWGWSCELPDGSGLQFGGVDQTADDGQCHTSVREGTQWKSIGDELRAKNPLQTQCDAVWALRGGCKDALARARSLYFEGRPADEETKAVAADVDPALEAVAAKLGARIAALKGLSGPNTYEAGQAKWALRHLESAAGIIKPIGGRVTPEVMATLRTGQIELELAADALGAEPPPRALSIIAWDPKTRLYLLFGGDHADYRTNDVWTFDPARRKWTQRHPESSPEPRADHHLDATGDGRVVMFGGYTRTDGYVHAGPDRWIYDLQKDTWTPDGHATPAVATGIRSAGYAPPGFPERFMKGPRPDAAANEATLKAIPVNTWVRLTTPIPLGGRDWGTWVLDPDRDLFYVYAGGHASYGGNDVARYHLSTGRWEITDPVELPLGGTGTNEQYPAGVNFNRRPWCRHHVWNSQAYEPAIKKLVNVGVTLPKIDPYFYVYDPDKSDWTERHAIPEGMNNSASTVQVRSTAHGLFAWSGTSAWLLDPAALEWHRLEVKGAMPSTSVDSCGMAYDARRDRVLLLTLGGYSKPYDGQIFSLDLKTNEVTPLNPQGMNVSKTWRILLREPAFDPTADLMILPQLFKHDGQAVPEKTPAYDPAKNRWILIHTPGATGQPFTDGSVCASLAYDPRRKLLWLGDASWNGGVWVMRLDAGKAELEQLTAAVPAGNGS